MGEVGGHQHRVPGREGAGLAVTHTGIDQVGAFTCAPMVTADCYVEGWWVGVIEENHIRKIRILCLLFPTDLGV